MEHIKLQFPVLIGDIGGTNARFALIGKKSEKMQIFPTKNVSDFNNIDEAIEQGVLPLVKHRPKTLLLAIAGPVEGEQISLTNSNWVIKPKELLNHLSFEQIFVMNDFEAQAFATAVIGRDYLQPIGNNSDVKYGSRVVMGPGTGLGVAGLVVLNQHFIPIAGEGGHVDYAPQTDRDFQLLPHFNRLDGRLEAEELLSGRGIVNVYQAIC